MKTYFYKRPDSLKLTDWNNMIGRLALPIGNYIIQAHAFFYSLESRWNPDELFEAKLKCGDDEVSRIMSMSSYIDPNLRYGENPKEVPYFVQNYQRNTATERVSVFFQMAVRIERHGASNSKTVDFTVFNASWNKGSIMATDVSILARAEDDLVMLDKYEPIPNFSKQKMSFTSDEIEGLFQKMK